MTMLFAGVAMMSTESRYTSDREFEVVQTLLSIGNHSPKSDRETTGRWDIPTPPLSEDDCASSLQTRQLYNSVTIDTCSSLNEASDQTRNISPPLKKRLLRQVCVDVFIDKQLFCCLSVGQYCQRNIN